MVFAWERVEELNVTFCSQHWEIVEVLRLLTACGAHTLVNNNS